MELDSFEIIFNVFLISVGVFIIVFAFWEHFKFEEKQRERMYEEISEIEAQKLSKKMRDSRVEMGLRKPKTFSTKRKPQKRQK